MIPNDTVDAAIQISNNVQVINVNNLLIIITIITIVSLIIIVLQHKVTFK